MPTPRSSTRLPTFACVGMERSGTTTLHQLLAQHPDIFLSPRFKEHFYFGSRYDRGIEWYRARFEGYGGQRHVGDLTPSYFRSSRSLRRLKETLGDDVRIILSLRHPVQRAISHYCHDVQRRRVDEPFSSFVDPLSTYYFVDYLAAIERVRDAFPPSSVLILLFERDIDGDLRSGLAKICDFLEIPRFDPEVRKANRSTYPQYLYGGPKGLEYVDEATGERFKIPRRWLVYCSGKGKGGGRVVRRPPADVVEQALARQAAITKSFDGDEIDALFERLYDPPRLLAGLEALGVDGVEEWWSKPSADIVLTPAPPPKRFSLDDPPPGERLRSKARRRLAL